MRHLLLLIALLLSPAAVWAEEMDRSGWQTHVDEKWGYSIQYPPDWQVEVGPSEGFHLKLVPPGGEVDRDCAVITVRKWWWWLFPDQAAIRGLTSEQFRESIIPYVDDVRVDERTPLMLGEHEGVRFRFSFSEIINGIPVSGNGLLVHTFRGNTGYDVDCKVFSPESADTVLEMAPIVESLRLR